LCDAQDPIVRFLTEYDALYPLVDDLGDDGITLYSTGPPRSLRPITRAIFQSWDGWPQFRDSWKGTNQKYRSVGIQHLLLPEPLRYLNDRFVSTNIGVPDTDSILRISSRELLPALEATFPMDVFQISFVPQAVRRYVIRTSPFLLASQSIVHFLFLTTFNYFVLKFFASLLPRLRFHILRLRTKASQEN
jgi:hypothetical protein